MRLLAPLLVALGTSSCVIVTWARARQLSPPPAGSVESLEPGADDLGDALAHLGAPIEAFQLEGGRYVLAYGWFQDSGWTVTVIVPIQNVSGRFTYGELGAKGKGVVLFFDGDDRITEIRRGYLRDILEPLRRKRPSMPLERPGDEGEGGDEGAG